MRLRLTLDLTRSKPEPAPVAEMPDVYDASSAAIETAPSPYMAGPAEQPEDRLRLGFQARAVPRG